MTQGDEGDEINKIAQSMALPCPVQVSKELSELIRPNDFIAGLGIRYLERIKTILGILETNLFQLNAGFEGTFPEGGVTFPIAITKGPFIKEEILSIRAAPKDDNSGKVILLTAILEER